MNLEELEKLKKEAAQETEEFNNAFVELFKERYENGNKRMAIINMLHLPINGIINMIDQDKKNLMCEILPELPDMFIRFMMPFTKIKHLWGKIPNEEFVNEYGKIYQSQFEEWFPTDEHKKNFEDWFNADKKGD